MDYRDNRQRWAESHQVVHFYAGQWCTFTPALTAHFHLSNGARMGNLNWLADTSGRGMRQAAGLMINYVYGLDEIEDNHEAYTTHGERVSSSSIRGLLKD